MNTKVISKIQNLQRDIKSLIRWVGLEADHYGFKAFIVGGIVRDILLGVKNLDLDIVIEGDAIKFAREISSDKSARLIQHKKFGTATVIFPNGSKIDFATARKEIYLKPAALPTISPGTIKDDLCRRDFTINAMAICISKNTFGEIVDLYNGQDDLKNKRIRVLHKLSFIDDPTRILRAIRFQERLKFNLDTLTRKLMKQAERRGMLEKTSPTRIWVELALLFKEHDPVKYIIRLNDICSLKFIHRNLSLTKSTIKSFTSLKNTIAWFNKSLPHRRNPDIWLMYFILLVHKLNMNELRSLIKKYDIGKGNRRRIISFAVVYFKVMRRMEKKDIKPSGIFSLLEPLSYEVILVMRALARKKIARQRIDAFLHIYNGIRPEIKGDDLIALGVKPGVRYQDILKKTLHAKIDKSFNTKLDELQFVRKLISKL